MPQGRTSGHWRSSRRSTVCQLPAWHTGLLTTARCPWLSPSQILEMSLSSSQKRYGWTSTATRRRCWSGQTHKTDHHTFRFNCFRKCRRDAALDNGVDVCGPPQFAGHTNTEQLKCCQSIDWQHLSCSVFVCPATWGGPHTSTPLSLMQRHVCTSWSS